jgi:hypothetical protein
MSHAQDDFDPSLRLDLERYFRRHAPRSIELARAPLLEKSSCTNASRFHPLLCSKTRCRSLIVSPPIGSAPTECLSRPQGWCGSIATANEREQAAPLPARRPFQRHRRPAMRGMNEPGLLHMSTDENDTTTQLKREFEFYLTGKEPSPLVLASAPLLENWHAIVVRFELERVPLRLAMVLAGSVTGHPRLGNARMIRTSQLIWLDRNRKWARTWNRIYRLGDGTDDR